MDNEAFRHTPPSKKLAWLETVGGSLLVPLVGMLFHRHDPLFLGNSFDWLIFPPLLFGIRYGFAHGFASALLTAMLMLLEVRLVPGAGAHAWLAYLFSIMLVGMLAGQFADVWLRRLGNMQLLNDLSSRRLSEFVRSYQLLKVSHDQLEERLASDTSNVRAAMMALRRRFAGLAQGQLLHRHGRDLLEFLSAYSQIQRASLYAVSAQGQLEPEALASVGALVECAAEHPMLRDSLASGALVSLRDTGEKLLERQDRQKLLAVLPLEDARGRIWAVVLIASMPFVSFNQRNLGMLAVLGAGVGDLILRSTRDVGPTGAAGDATDFREELAMWSHHAKRYKVAATLMGIDMAPSISGESAREPFDQWLFEQMRGLDVGLRRDNAAGGRSLLVLMPMTNAQGAQGYRERVSLLLEERLGKAVDASLIQFHEHRVDGATDPDVLLDTLARECGIALA